MCGADEIYKMMLVKLIINRFFRELTLFSFSDL